MIDLNKYLTKEEDKQFIKDICLALAPDSQCEVFLKYGALPLLLEPHGEEIQVWSHDVMLAKFDTIDEMLVGFKLNDKPFVSCIGEMVDDG